MMIVNRIIPADVHRRLTHARLARGTPGVLICDAVRALLYTFWVDSRTSVVASGFKEEANISFNML